MICLNYLSVFLVLGFLATGFLVLSDTTFLTFSLTTLTSFSTDFLTLDKDSFVSSEKVFKVSLISDDFSTTTSLISLIDLLIPNNFLKNSNYLILISYKLIFDYL